MTWEFFSIITLSYCVTMFKIFFMRNLRNALGVLKNQDWKIQSMFQKHRFNVPPQTDFTSTSSSSLGCCTTSAMSLRSFSQSIVLFTSFRSTKAHAVLNLVIDDEVQFFNNRIGTRSPIPQSEFRNRNTPSFLWMTPEISI